MENLPPHPNLPKKYSTLGVREKLRVDIEYLQAQNEHYSHPSYEGDYDNLIEKNKEHIGRLQQLANHYDKEVKDGYRNPATRRNNKPL